MTTFYCGIGDCKTELAPGRIGNCGNHPVNDAWKTFWDMWPVDLDKIPEVDKLKDALLESFRVAAGLQNPRKEGAIMMLGRFNWHPDPAIDFCVEVDVLEGMAFDAKVGLLDVSMVNERISKAMQFRVGGDERAVSAKAHLRQLEVDMKNVKI